MCIIFLEENHCSWHVSEKEIVLYTQYTIQCINGLHI